MDSNKRVWIYTGLALVAGVGLVSVASRKESTSSPSGPPPANPQEPLPKALFEPVTMIASVLLIGDSLAQGLAPPLKQLASDSGVAFSSDGRSGTRIAQWASQTWLLTDLVATRPTHTLISLGTNDMKMSDPKSETAALASLITSVRAASRNVIWIAPPMMPFADGGVREMIASTDVIVFDSTSLAISRGSDQIHPTPQGYAGWAGSIWKYLVTGGILRRSKRR